MIEPSQDISFSVLQEAIRQARLNALKALNAALVNLYWQVGAFVRRQLSQSKWGEKKVDQLADFLQQQEPGLKGFDRRNIYRMVEFYNTYSASSVVVPVAPQLQNIENQSSEKVVPAEPPLGTAREAGLYTSLLNQLLDEDIRKSILVKLTWTNHLLIFSRCKTAEERQFYIQVCIREKYSKRELDRQISAGLFERVMITNKQISPALKDIYPNSINQFKDSYVFEFLDLPEQHTENDLQKGLIGQMKNFILELGKDFLFIGEEYKIQLATGIFILTCCFFTVACNASWHLS